MPLLDITTKEGTLKANTALNIFLALAQRSVNVYQWQSFLNKTQVYTVANKVLLIEPLRVAIFVGYRYVNFVKIKLLQQVCLVFETIFTILFCFWAKLIAMLKKLRVYE